MSETPHRYTAALADEIELAWQDRWEEDGTFRAPNPAGPWAQPDAVAGREKLFVLDMFPYPSGTGLHVGHPLGYIGTDVFGRFRRMQGDKLLGWTYFQEQRTGTDNSNTQYALLGLHAGQTAGAKIDPEVWQSIRDYYISTQQASGGWGYARIRGDEPRLTMTTAGLCGLLIAGMDLNTGRETPLPDGTADKCFSSGPNDPTTPPGVDTVNADLADRTAQLFSGDVLFEGSIGRTDLPGSDHDRLMRSLADLLMRCDDDTIVHPGHMGQTTIGRERATNPFLAGVA